MVKKTCYPIISPTINLQTWMSKFLAGLAGVAAPASRLTPAQLKIGFDFNQIALWIGWPARLSTGARRRNQGQVAFTERSFSSFSPFLLPSIGCNHRPKRHVRDSAAGAPPKPRPLNTLRRHLLRKAASLLRGQHQLSKITAVRGNFHGERTSCVE